MPIISIKTSNLSTLIDDLISHNPTIPALLDFLRHESHLMSKDEWDTHYSESFIQSTPHSTIKIRPITEENASHFLKTLTDFTNFNTRHCTFITGKT